MMNNSIDRIGRSEATDGFVMPTLICTQLVSKPYYSIMRITPELTRILIFTTTCKYKKN